MNRSELKQIIREVIEEGIFPQSDEYITIVWDAQAGDPIAFIRSNIDEPISPDDVLRTLRYEFGGVWELEDITIDEPINFSDLIKQRGKRFFENAEVIQF